MLYAACSERIHVWKSPVKYPQAHPRTNTSRHARHAMKFWQMIESMAVGTGRELFSARGSTFQRDAGKGLEERHVVLPPRCLSSRNSSERAKKSIHSNVIGQAIVACTAGRRSPPTLLVTSLCSCAGIHAPAKQVHRHVHLFLTFPIKTLDYCLAGTISLVFPASVRRHNHQHPKRHRHHHLYTIHCHIIMT